MVKKIILLVLSFSFSVTSVVYGTVTKADPVSSGTGTGTSVKIKDTSALSNVMSQIPSYEDYTAEGGVKEKYPDFKPFTMIETGYGKNKSERATSRTVVKEGDNEYLRLVEKTEEKTNHTLSISFAEDAVYYHSVGSQTTTKSYYEYTMETRTVHKDGVDYEYSYYSYNADEDFVDATRTTINFDAEIYHSKDATMIKYNKYETVEEFADTLNQYDDPAFKTKSEEEVLDEEKQMEKEMQAKVEAIREENYGVWLKLETYTDEELETKFGDLWNSETAPSEENYEQYKNLMIDYMIYETCNLVSEAEAKSFATANASNCAYLGKLASFITTQDEDVSFKKEGNEYKLVTTKTVQTGVDEETNQPIYDDLPVGKEAYISTVFGNAYNNADRYWTNANLSYVVGSDVAVVDQYASWGEQSGRHNGHLTRQFDMDTTTHFLALDNTVAGIEKGAKVKTITEAYSDGLREIYSDYLDKMMEEGN